MKRKDNFINKRLVTFSIAAILCMTALATINVSAAQGDDCSNPISVPIAPVAPGALLFMDLGQTTCGRVDDYSATCLGSYDGGEDIIYELIVLADVCVDITMDPYADTWTGILIDDECPDTGTCIDYNTGSSGIRNLYGVNLLASVGNYWIMVDTWPTPTCITNFDLTITQCAGSTPGDDCSDPITVSIPGDLTYTDVGQTTCGRVDDYDATAMGGYDNGEDIIYELTVTSVPSNPIKFTLTSGSSYTGMGLFDDCPDVGTLLVDVGSYSTDEEMMYTFTSTGTYYLMIDTWPSPDCISSFDLTIEEYVPGPGETCGTAVIAYEGITYCADGAPYWYVYTATDTLDVTVETCGLTTIDSKLYIWDECSDLTYLYYNDDFCGLQSSITFPATAGEDYYINWQTYNGYDDGIPFDFRIALPPHDVGVSEIVSPFAAPPKGTDMVYGDGLNGWQSGLDDGPLTFDITDPGTITSLAPQSVDFFGGCWAEDTWYALEFNDYTNVDLYTIDETDGSLNVVGDTGIDGYYETTAGLAYDPTTSTMYASTIDGWDGLLYTVNMGTGAATLVGSMGTDTPIMGIAFDNDGNLYGIDLLDDHLYQINPSDASLTDIGPLGINMNYAQDIAFDRTNEIMYWAMYGSSPPKDAKPESLLKAAPPGVALKGYGYLCTIDLSTGTATVIDELYGSAEIGAFAIPPFVPEECWPMGTYPVEVKVKNYGGHTESMFDVSVEITETLTSTIVYADTETVIMAMAPGAEVSIASFAPWTTTVVGDGTYVVHACTLLFPVDDNPANDCKDEDGCIIQHVPPIAEANGPYFANLDNGFTVTFDSTGSYDPDGSIILYEWDFGDGSTATGSSPTHTYLDSEEAHDLTVTLTVTDDDTPANTGSDTAIVHVAAHDTDPPIIQIVHPDDGDTVNGVVTIEWFAVDDDYPQGIGIPISLYYRPVSAYVTDVHLIADGLTNNIDEFTGEYDWSTSSLSDGSYVLVAETHDMNQNIVHDTIVITVSNGNAGVMVSDVHIFDKSISSDAFVKDGDDLEIKAGITGPTELMTTITADLSGFGMGTNVEATSFDGFTATWTLSNVVCTLSDGPITVTVTVNEAHSNSATITADNTAPEMVIEKPVNGLYFFNVKLLPLSRSIIIGPINIELEGSSDIAKAEFFVDGVLLKTMTEEPFEWRMNIKAIGQHTLEVKVYDGAGNTATQSQDATIYNLFGIQW